MPGFRTRPCSCTHSSRVPKKKGTPLTELEVCNIRDQATCIAVTFATALAMEQERGYADIVAEDCWNEWQRLRRSIQQSPR